MPFYNAKLVTRILKNILGQLYNYNGDNFLKALYDTSKNCHYVENREGI